MDHFFLSRLHFSFIYVLVLDNLITATKVGFISWWNLNELEFFWSVNGSEYEYLNDMFVFLFFNIWILWHYDREGEYFVKFSYNLAVQILDSKFVMSSRDDSCGWAVVWKLHVPPKVWIFLCRALLNILPTLDKLKSKKVVLDSKCHICGCLEETVMHALVGCG